MSEIDLFADTEKKIPTEAVAVKSAERESSDDEAIAERLECPEAEAYEKKCEADKKNCFHISLTGSRYKDKFGKFLGLHISAEVNLTRNARKEGDSYGGRYGGFDLKGTTPEAVREFYAEILNEKIAECRPFAETDAIKGFHNFLTDIKESDMLLFVNPEVEKILGEIADIKFLKDEWNKKRQRPVSEQELSLAKELSELEALENILKEGEGLADDILRQRVGAMEIWRSEIKQTLENTPLFLMSLDDLLKHRNNKRAEIKQAEEKQKEIERELGKLTGTGEAVS
ncbi:MAG: hypothetical protein PHQ00_07780 [Phycisphaerae bacterium]|nr:hypothetical protein [Phycisphaerae bacterium]